MAALSNYEGDGIKNAVFSFKNFFAIIPITLASIYKYMEEANFLRTEYLRSAWTFKNWKAMKCQRENFTS